jgi:hypothetical protein
MKRWLLAAVLALASAAAHADAASTDATLKRITQEMADALAPGDRAVWERYTDPSLLYVTEDNLVKSRKQFLADLAPLPAGYSGQIAIVEFQSRDFGPFAVTTYIQDEHENVEGHELHAHYRTTDTWRRTPAGWRLAASETFSVPIDPPAGTASADALANFEGRYRLSAKTVQTIAATAITWWWSAREGRRRSSWWQAAMCSLRPAGRARCAYFNAIARDE